MAIVNEVITKFGFVGDTSKLDGYNKDLASSIKILSGFAVATAGAVAATARFVTGTTQALDPLIQLSRNTKTSIEFMQEFGYMASQTGSDLGAVESTIESLSAKIGEAAQTGSEDFSRLGISVRDAGGQVKGAEQILGEVQSRFNAMGLSQAEKISFAEKLGIDKSLVQLLGKSGEEMDKLRAKAERFGVVSKAGADDAAALNDSLSTLKFGLGSVQQQIAIGLAPELMSLTDGFADFLAENKDLIINGLTVTAEFLGDVADAMIRLAPVVLLGAAAWGAYALATGGAATVMAVILSPVVLITAGIVALLLVIDDLIVAFDGGQSVIGDFFSEFLGIDIGQVMRDALKDVIAFIDMATKLFNEFTENISIGGAFDFAANALGFGGTSSTSNSTSNNVDQNVTVNVSASDPVAAGAAVADSLKAQLSDANALFSVGGR